MTDREQIDNAVVSAHDYLVKNFSIHSGQYVAREVRGRLSPPKTPTLAEQIEAKLISDLVNKGNSATCKEIAVEIVAMIDSAKEEK